MVTSNECCRSANKYIDTWPYAFDLASLSTTQASAIDTALAPDILTVSARLLIECFDACTLPGHIEHSGCELQSLSDK